MTAEKVKPDQQPEVVSDIDWIPEMEVQLFYALRGHKPVGISRYFQMICVLDAFVNSTAKDVSSQVLWKHLETMYDMEALNENEDIPFPNNDSDFTLEGNPEFEELMASKQGKAKEKNSGDGQETNKTPKPSKHNDVNKSSKAKSSERENDKNSKEAREEVTVKREAEDRDGERPVKTKKKLELSAQKANAATQPKKRRVNNT